MNRHMTPGHLPERLAIGFWGWMWVTNATPSEPYHDLERCFAGLTERGFNCLRIDAGLNWCLDLQGEPRGEIGFGSWVDGCSANLRGMNALGGGRYDVLKRLLTLIELAEQHEIYLILSSWEYQDQSGFVEPAVKAEVFGVPIQERIMHMARQQDRLLGIIKERGLKNTIAFVEPHNEFDASEFPQGEEGTKLLADAIAFLRDRHPDILISADFGGHDPALTPENTQVYDRHMYAGTDLFFNGAWKESVLHPDFDPGNPTAIPLVRELVTRDFASYAEVMERCSGVKDFWRPAIWLYHNLDNRAWDRWVHDHFDHYGPLAMSVADQQFRQDYEEASRRGLPLVLDEGGWFFSPWYSRFEESAQGLSLFEHMCELAIKYDYWGFMTVTNSGPDMPVWQENPEWLFKINSRFLNGGD